MARRDKRITIEGDGRDGGKLFVITEMPATAAEKWAIRAFLAMGQSGVEIPDDLAKAGLIGVASMGMRAILGMPWALVEPLLDEMWACVAYIPDPARPATVITGHMLDTQIEDVGTRLMLRQEVLDLHLGFSLADVTSKFRLAMTATTAEDDTSGSLTSPPSSAQ
jgi:hypothetical protein